MKSVIDLTGKTILITGASSGIGAAASNLCAQLGSKVVLVARDEEKLEKTTAGLPGEGHRWYSFDLTRVDEIEGFVKMLIQEVGPLDGFVHCAAAARRAVPLRVMKPNIVTNNMMLYYNSFVELTRCITKRNCYRPGMSIVGISSVLSDVAITGRMAYSAAKAALNASVRCIAKEMASNGIRANVVSPGTIDTKRHQDFQAVAGNDPETAAFIARQYIGLGQPDDVANTIAFLLSDASRLITGSNINVDGGLRSV